MSIRVLQVLDKLNHESGVSAVVMNYYRVMNKEEFHIDFMVNELPDSKLYDEITAAGGKVFQMPSLNVKNLFRYQMELKGFFKKQEGYHIVHGHVANAAAFYMKAAKKRNIAVRILHSHNTEAADIFWKKYRNRILSHIGIKMSNYYAACGKKAAEYLFSSQDNVMIIPNAVDVYKFKFHPEIRNKMREQYRLGRQIVIGHIGRFCPQKNQKFLIAILEILIKRDQRYHLLLIGEGEEKGKIECFVKEKRLGNHVTFTGAVENVENYYQMMDCFVLPSIFEGAPLVGVEAQYNGLPCLLSSAITKEISSLQTTYLELEKGCELWAESIERICSYGRIEPALKGFNLEEEGKRLEYYYRTLGKKNG